MKLKAVAFVLVMAFCPVVTHSTSVYQIGTTEVDNFLQGWLTVQNAGDFVAYENLYAEHFTGIRRSGTRVVPMNRQRWMSDREKMFQKRFKVVAEETSISPGNDNAVVSFVQRWESASYKDKGPKQLILIRDANHQLKIAQEVMLESLVLFHAPTIADTQRNVYANKPCEPVGDVLARDVPAAHAGVGVGVPDRVHAVVRRVRDRLVPRGLAGDLAGLPVRAAAGAEPAAGARRGLLGDPRDLDRARRERGVRTPAMPSGTE